MKSRNIKISTLSFSAFFFIIAVGSALTTDADEPRKKGTSQYVQVEEINRMIREVWEEYNLRPSSKATDGEWCRRVYLDLLGRIPSVDELTAFTKDRSQSKKEKLIEKLLDDDQYVEEYARNWTTIWSNILIGRTGGTDNDSFINRNGMQKYLRDTFARNKPYNKMVHELVSATGSTTPGTKNFNGATNFLVMKVNEEKASLATAATSKTFLGLQVQCTQCHNHPFNEWKQEKYWEMNAFFRQTRALRRFKEGTRDIASVELIDQDFEGEGPKAIRNANNALVYYELRNGMVQSATPKFVTGEAIGTSGYVKDVNRRAELAKFIVNSEYLEKTAVNRMWGHFLGYGFTKPIDDMGPHNLPSHPELLEYLAKEFRKAGFDNKQLITWITLSDAYGLSSKTTTSNAGDDPLLGETPKFTHFYLRQMRAEELYQSLVTATEAHKGISIEEQEKLKNKWLQQFSVAFGTDEGDETTSFNGTIPQVLVMFNGELVKKAINSDKAGLFAKVLNSNQTFAKKIDHLFQAGLGRRASKDFHKGSKNLAASYMKKDGKTPHQTLEKMALQDIWWSILNSNEFIFNH